ncbi:nucleotide exchange factor GrpE [Gordonia sp. CPCC 205515]|uniref:nucleotide exchange factor GrpE n=1 Tax=Gordonia sp. CPCC 205515 TaxID=3140791 RepID=UPI003AF405C0
MTESVADPTGTEQAAADETSDAADLQEHLDRLAEQVQDLTRVVARQAKALDILVASDSARSGQRTDTALLVDLFALFTDADTCARSAASDRETTAFTALRDGLERLIAGRDGAVIVPRAGDEFDVSVMEAGDTRPAVGNQEIAGTVVEVIRPGLVVAGRSVRPALVTVFT